MAHRNVCCSFLVVSVAWVLYILLNQSLAHPPVELTSWNEHIVKRNTLSRRLQQQLNQNADIAPFTIKRKSHAASTRFQNKSHLTEIDLSAFNKVISVDTNARTAWVECSCTMEHLVDTLLSQYNMIPQVIPEFKHITVAGAIQGLGIESTSFKYGLFHSTALQYELLLTNATLINVSNHSDSNLFFAIPGSLNTIATVIAVEISLVDAKPFVLLQYNQIIGIRNLHHRLTTNHAKYMQKYDFLEIIRDEKNSDRFVEIVGAMRDECDDGVCMFDMSWYYHKLFYQHVFEDTTSSSEYLKLKQYLFRHDRGAFFVMNDFPNHVIFRVIMYWMMSAKRLFEFRNRKHTRRNEEWMEHAMSVHDYMVSDRALLLYYETVVSAYYPSGYLWFCPVLVDGAEWSESVFAKMNTSNKLGINIGIYLKNNYATNTWSDTYRMYNDLELFLCNEDGVNWFYGPSYLSETQFWKCYNQTKYKQIRKQISAHLPDIYHGKVAQMTAKYEKMKPGFDLDWNDIVAYDTIGGSMKFAFDYLAFMFQSLFEYS